MRVLILGGTGFIGLMHVSSARAQAAGLTLAPPEVTARDTRAALDPARTDALAQEPEAVRRLVLTSGSEHPPASA